MNPKHIHAALYDMDEAAFRLMGKFHHETDCGEDHLHWAECQALAQAFGYESWGYWKAIRNAAMGDFDALPNYWASKEHEPA